MLGCVTEPLRALDDDAIASRFPRSAGYPPDWGALESMGPHVLWLTEYLAEAMTLRAGQRVLDLGCGKALSSIFLAKEFGVEVWATDLWIKPTPNFERIAAHGLDRTVYPVYAEAHALPYADGFFDAIVSIDAYHYFGTDDMYAGYLARFLRPGGTLGIVVPGVATEVGVEGPPPAVAPHWSGELATFHTPAWWQAHWMRSLCFSAVKADWIPDGAALWLRWAEMANAAGRSFPDEGLLRAGGDWLGFTRAVATRASIAPDPSG